MNTKAKGARRERQAKKILETAGYLVLKAGGSLGMFDLVGLHKQHARLIQVKSGRAPGKQEMETLKEFDTPTYATKELWVFYDRIREPHITIL
jgi:Holliday junction resolvase